MNYYILFFFFFVYFYKDHIIYVCPKEIAVVVDLLLIMTVIINTISTISWEDKQV